MTAWILTIVLMLAFIGVFGTAAYDAVNNVEGYFGTLDKITPGRYVYSRIPKAKRLLADGKSIIICKAVEAGPYWPDGAELIFEKNADDFEYGHFYLIKYLRLDGRNITRWGKIVQCTATGLVPNFSSNLPRDNNFTISGKLVGVRIDDVYTFFDVTKNFNKPISNC